MTLMAVKYHAKLNHRFGGWSKLQWMHTQSWSDDANTTTVAITDDEGVSLISTTVNILNRPPSIIAPS